MTLKVEILLEVVKVGLLGLGTVGGGTATVLLRNADEIQRRLGRRIEITHVAGLGIAEQDIVDAGDVLQWALPLAAYGTTAIYQDWEGTKQYTWS